MIKNTFIFSLLFTLSFPAVSVERGLFSRYFKLIPESHAFLTMGSPFQRELKTSSIKAMVWNVKKAELKNWRNEFLRFSPKQDLFILQEAYGNSTFTDTLKSFNTFQWNFGISFLVPKDEDAPSGTMIGAPVRPSVAIVKHSPDVEPVVFTPKSITLTKYPLMDRHDELLVVSVHAINFQSTQAFKRHIDQIVDHVREHTGPVILAGDFNTWNKARMTYLFKVAEKLQLTEVKFKNSEYRLNFGTNYLDHTFTKGIKVKNSYVLMTNGSDHRPLFIEFDLI